MPYNSQPGDPLDLPAIESTIFPQDPERPQPIAPWQHTLAVMVVLATWALLGRGRTHLYATGPHASLYISTSMMLWLLLGSVVAGVYNRRQFFFNTLQRAARPWPKEFARAFAIYFASFFLFAIATGILYVTPLRHHLDRFAVEALAPQTVRELLLWFAVSATAGFCEEHIFRGYLLSQSIAWISATGASHRNASLLSITITSLLFGALHLYEGIGGAILITLLGALYAVMALRFKNLRAVILAHTLQDFLVAVFLLLHRLHAS